MTVGRRGERGMAMIIVLAVTVILTAIGASLVGLMHTDITHAGIQHALASSFFVAQAGLAQAFSAVASASDPVAYAGDSGGPQAYAQGGRYTWWVDVGPAAGSPCGAGFKTLEALGEVSYLGRWINSRVRACGVPGTPVLTAIFGVSLVEAQGATSRTYVAPYPAGAPGAPRGGAIGSFTELNFADAGLRLNAVSETGPESVTLRDGTFFDYQLFGFSSRPTYESNPNVEAMPWITGAFGDIVKAQPTSGPRPNDCGTPYACVTVQNSNTDVPSVAALRTTENLRHLYMAGMTYQVLPEPTLDPATAQAQAAANTRNAALNARAGVTVTGSAYTPSQFNQLVTYVASGCPGLSPPSVCELRGMVYVDGTYQFTRSVTLSGPGGDLTLAVAGDLILDTNVSVTIRHDLSTVTGRRTPGLEVFGVAVPARRATNVCSGEQANGSGRIILCGGNNQRLTVDGLVYTADGMSVGSQATVDVIGAMYHANRGTGNPSYTNQNATVVVRFDPLALSTFGQGITRTSWQQLK